MIETGAHPWDWAAPLVIVEEAGGRFTTATGERPIDGASAVASNGLIHDGCCVSVLHGRRGSAHAVARPSKTRVDSGFVPGEWNAIRGPVGQPTRGTTSTEVQNMGDKTPKRPPKVKKAKPKAPPPTKGA